MYLLVCLWTMCVDHVCTCLWRSEKGLDPLKLELQTVVRPDVVAGNCAWSSASAVSALKC